MSTETRSRLSDAPSEQISSYVFVFAAIILLGVAAYFGPVEGRVHPATVAAILAVVAISLAIVRGAWGELPPISVGFAIVAVFLTIGLSEPFLPPGAPASRQGLLPISPAAQATSCFAAVWLILRKRPRWAVMAVALGLAIMGATLLVAAPQPNIDVLLAHDQAAAVLFSGGNPYSDRVVIPNTSPYSPGQTIVGYPYTPPALFAYASSAHFFGDSRWFSVTALPLTVVLLGAVARGTSARTAALAVTLMSSLPGIPLLLYFGWTEPLCILLLVGTFVLWHQAPTSSAVFAGLALASKQYLVLLAPLLIVLALRTDRRRAVVLFGVFSASIGIPVLFGVSSYIRSVLGNTSQIAVRPDGSSLQALAFNSGGPGRWPFWLTLGLPLALSFMGALLGKSVHATTLWSCLVLIAFFLLAAAAFMNYWMLTAAVIISVLAIREAPPLTAKSDMFRSGALKRW